MPSLAEIFVDYPIYSQGSPSAQIDKYMITTV